MRTEFVIRDLVLDEVACRFESVQMLIKDNFNRIKGSYENGELDEAAIIGRLVMPYGREANSVRIHMDHFASRLAKTGLMREAALVLGWNNFQFSTAGVTRQPNELRAMNSTSVLLRKHFSPEILAQLCAEGAALSEDEVCKIAVM